MKKKKQSRVTLKMVADKAGVSVSAVSMILNNYKLASFPESTKRRVMEACELLGYQKRTVRGGKAVLGKLIVLVIPSYKNPFYTDVVQSATTRAQELGYNAVTVCTYRDVDTENNLPELCRSVNAGGVLCFYQPERASVLRELHEQFPMVQLYDATAAPDLNVINVDGHKVGDLIAEHLYQLNHRRIAYIATPFSKRQTGFKRRLDGIRDYFAEMGLDPMDCVRCYGGEDEMRREERLEGYEVGRRLTDVLLMREEPVTAFVGANDVIAYGVMDALIAQGKRIPRDYSVCGCDNLITSGYETIGLTTVDHYVLRKACSAVEMLIKEMEARIDWESVRTINITRVEYEPRLIIRGSTGKCKGK